MIDMVCVYVDSVFSFVWLVVSQLDTDCSFRHRFPLPLASSIVFVCDSANALQGAQPSTIWVPRHVVLGFAGKCVRAHWQAKGVDKYDCVSLGSRLSAYFNPVQSGPV